MTSRASRRQFFKAASLAAMSGLPLSVLAGTEFRKADAKLKVFCVGGHPDDPESGCGGTLARFSAAGHDVNILYLTRGEAGIEGKTNGEAAAIRSREAEAACKLLSVKPHFLGQIDGDTVFDSEWIRKMADFMQSEQPDLVFTQWPIDTHRDHQVASLLTIQARLRVKKKFQLYFYEVCAGEQTMTFHPTDYVDIAITQETKRKALYCHVSQDPPGIYACGHEIMEKFRGAEAGLKAAEAFVKFNGNNSMSAII